MRFAAVVFLAFLLLPAVAIAGPLEDGKSALEHGDYQTAFQLLQPLAEHGNAEAQYLTGMMYRDGRGIKQDYAAGNKWVRAAADQGNKMAQLSIGSGYAYDGEKNDYVQAYMWLTLSDATGDKHATGMLYDLGTKMTPEQLDEANNRIAEWKPTPAPEATAKIEKIPHFDSLTEEQFEEQTDLHTATPDGDRYLAYSLRLPKGWQKAISDKIIMEPEGLPRHRKLGRIGRYYAPQTLEISSRIDIIAKSLSSDFSLPDMPEWLGLTGKGYTSLGKEEVNQNRLVVLYRQQVRNQFYIVRSVAQISGSRIVLLSYFVPEEKWDDEKAMQEKVVNSFQLWNR